MDGVVRRFDALVAAVCSSAARVRLVGVDGCGGVGKTTFASRLARVAGSAPVVHTDDFATHDEPLDWWPRMLHDVVEPLLRGERATFQPYDWVRRRRSDEVISVEPAPLVVIEGVAATRAAWRDSLALRIWVDAPRDLRLRRGIARDGEELREFWQWWMAAEDGYVAAEQPLSYSDLVVDGAPSVSHDPEQEFVEIALSAPR